MFMLLAFCVSFKGEMYREGGKGSKGVKKEKEEKQPGKG